MCFRSNLKRRPNDLRNYCPLGIGAIALLEYRELHTRVIIRRRNPSITEVGTFAKNRSRPFNPQCIRNTPDGLLDTRRIAIEYDDFADSGFSEMFFVYGELLQGRENGALDGVCGKRSVREGFQPATKCHKEKAIENSFVKS